MNITQVQIHLNRGDPPKVKAWADIIIDHEFIVKGLTIREDAKEGYCFVTMPYKMRVTNHDEVRQDIAHPITEPCRKYIEDKVLDEYEAILNKMESKNSIPEGFIYRGHS